MTKTLNEIADLIEEAQDALDVAGQAVGGVGGKGALYDKNGNEIDLRELADQLRSHAADNSE